MTDRPLTETERDLMRRINHQLRADLETARALHIGSDHYLTRREYAAADPEGGRALYARLYGMTAPVGGHRFVADYIGLPMTKGGAGMHAAF